MWTAHCEAYRACIAGQHEAGRQRAGEPGRITPPPPDPEAMEADIRVKDAGMALISSVSPAFRWQAGSADISLSVRGRPGAPTIAGTAAVAKGSVYCPYTKYPLTNVGALVRLSDKMLQVRPSGASYSKTCASCNGMI